MAPGCVNILLHHGGAFSKEGSLTYEGGDVAIFRNIDKDVMSYFHLVDLAKSVGCKDGDILYYGIPGRSLDNGIDHIKDDSSVSEMMKYANQTNYLEVYVQHNEHTRVGHPTVGDMEQHETPAQTMAQLPSKIETLLLSLQMRRRRMKLLMAVHVLFVYWFYVMRKKQSRLIREPCRFDPAHRTKKLNDMIYESDILCVQQLRMDRRCFWTLCSLVREVGGLRDTRNVNVEEMVAMFLHILAYDEKSRDMRTDYQRSIETISRHFNHVLGAVLKLWRVLLRSPQPISDNCNEERWKWFKVKKGKKTRKMHKKREKRIWSAEEENALVDILLDMNDSGWKADTGHKSGYMTYIEKELAKKFPNANIKADPHIMSQVKKLKKLLSYVLDIQTNGSGFGWDDERKMVVGDKELFDGWAKSRNGAGNLYMKPFVHYDKLCEIYANDLAKGSNAKGPGDEFDFGEEQSADNMTETAHQSESVVDSQSHLQCPGSNPSSGNKYSGTRKRKYVEDDAVSFEFSNLTKSLTNLVEAETTNAAAMKVIQSAYDHKLKAQKQTEQRREQLYSVLTKFPEFTRDQLVRAARIIGSDATALSMFYTTPEEFKSEYIRQVLESSK